jgi:hypothetical protein
MQPITAERGSEVLRARVADLPLGHARAHVVLHGLGQFLEELEVVRPQPGQAVTIGVNARRPIVCSSSCATITSCVREAPGSGVSEMRMVSPMPSCSSTPSAAVEATMPLLPMPASVRPRCSAKSLRPPARDRPRSAPARR